MRPVRPVVLAAVLATAVALGAAGCATSSTGASGRPPAGSPRTVVLAAVQQTQAATSADIALRVSVSGTPDFGSLVPGGTGSSSSPIALDVTGTGAFDFAQKTGRITLTTPASGTSPARTIEIRIIGNDLYLNAPELLALDGGKPWVHVDTSSYRQDQGQNAGALGGFQDGDPGQVLTLLQRLGAQVTDVGPADIGGVATTHYRGSVDLTSPSTSGSSTGNGAFGRGLAKLFGFGAVPVDVWVDSDGRARQVQVTLSLFGVAVSAQEDFSDFGTPVVVDAPPAGQVADGSALLQSGMLKNLLGHSTGQ